MTLDRLLRRPGVRLGCLAVTLLLVGCGPKETPPAPQAITEPAAPVTPLDQASALLKAGDLDAAEQRIQELLIEQPDDPGVTLLSAQLSAARRQFREAVTTASTLLKPDVNQEAAALIADIAARVPEQIAGLESDAWTAMETTLESEPARPGVRVALVRMLNRLGHRHRACHHAEWLCRRGDADRPMLLSLIARRDQFPLGDSETTDETATPLAIARRHYSLRHFSDAYEVLAPIAAKGWDHAETAALFGEVLAETQSFGEMIGWLSSCPQDVASYPEYWTATGVWLMSEERFEEAAGALLQAIEIDPTHAPDYQRLGVCLRRLGLAQQSAEAASRGREVTLTQAQASMWNERGTEAYLKSLAQLLNRLGRPFEFMAWQEELGRGMPGLEQRIDQQRRRFLASAKLAEMSRLSRRMGLTKDRFAPPGESSLAALAASQTQAGDVSESSDSTSSGVSLVNVAAAVGMKFRYKNHPTPVTHLFRLHETLGGGIGVIDYDLDGRPDVYLCQGSGDPPDRLGDESNVIYRNTKSRLIDRTVAAGLTDYGYSSGVAVGDINQDGFADIYLGALGGNRLLINQGDGTFRESRQYRESESRYTSSVAIADINGDGLADLVECNYVDTQGLFVRRELDRTGIPPGLSPLSFRAAADRVFVTDRNGEFRESNLEPENRPPAASLGLVVTDLDATANGNEIFIANDAYPNRLWSRDDAGEWFEHGSIAGVAVDFSYTETAGMGIAAEDFDTDGRLDLHVTNFWQQPSSLFMQRSDGSFTDLAPRYRLDSSTFAMLGFGTQSLDIQRDGNPDIVILNGHIEDFGVLGHPFRMSPQVLLHARDRFEDVSVEDSSDYFQTEMLGRALAKLDWNRDGQTDLVAGHLDQPAALLENRTSRVGDWIRFRVVGTSCGRDAIGAKIRLRFSDQTRTAWRIAGNGYLCSNEPVIDITIPAGQSADQVEVDWPDGTRQSSGGALKPGRVYLWVQGHAPMQE